MFNKLDTPIANPAVRHFTGQGSQQHDQRQYEEWYTLDTLIHLANKYAQANSEAS